MHYFVLASNVCAESSKYYVLTFKMSFKWSTLWINWWNEISTWKTNKGQEQHMHSVPATNEPLLVSFFPYPFECSIFLVSLCLILEKETKRVSYFEQQQNNNMFRIGKNCVGSISREICTRKLHKCSLSRSITSQMTTHEWLEARFFTAVNGRLSFYTLFFHNTTFRRMKTIFFFRRSLRNK